jgi:hypothetical protein
MPDANNDLPSWIIEQRGLLRGDPRYKSRRFILRTYAIDRAAMDIAVSFEEYRAVLRFLDRGYSLKDDQISAVLGSLYRSGKLPRQPRGRPIVIDGVEYRSARAASEMIGVSHQTVMRRVKRDTPEWSDWREA